MTNLFELLRATETGTIVRAVADVAKYLATLATILWVIHILTKRKD